MSIVPRILIGDLDVTSYPFSVLFGTDIGAPQNVYDVLESALADGEVVSSSRTSNRTITLPVLVEGADFAELADNEATLIAECERALSTLTIDPGDNYGPETVFDTFRIQAVHERADDWERALLRSYLLTIQALPFGRPAAPVTIGAEFVSADVVVEDDCESTSGWSASSPLGGTVVFSVDSTAGNFVTGTGAVKAVMPITSVGGGNQAAAATFTKTGLSIDASGGGYLTVAVKAEWGTSNLSGATITTSGGGTESVDVLTGEAITDGFTRYSFAVPDLSTITALSFYASQGILLPSGSTPANPAMWFDSIGLADAATDNQSVTSFEVLGSMRTEASFAISAPAGLGDVALYTCRDLGDGFRPDLRRWQTAGSDVADADAINGSHVSAGAGATFKAPASMYRPGAYAVLARVDDGGAITLTAQVEIGGVLVGDEYEVTSPTVSVTDYTLIRVGVIDLPPLGVDPASGAVVKFVLSGSAKVDEILTLPLEESSLTWVACGSGSPSATVASRLWLDEPSAANGGRPKRYVGNDVDRLDARYVRPASAGRHLLYPGRNLAYLLTSAAGGAALEVTYYPRAHSNNAYDPDAA